MLAIIMMRLELGCRMLQYLDFLKSHIKHPTALRQGACNSWSRVLLMLGETVYLYNLLEALVLRQG